MTEQPAFVVIRYRDPSHELQTVIYEYRGEKAGERALSHENEWQRTEGIKRLAEAHVRRADDLFHLLAENEALFVDAEAVVG